MTNIASPAACDLRMAGRKRTTGTGGLGPPKIFFGGRGNPVNRYQFRRVFSSATSTSAIRLCAAMLA
jgi:hypothetical protein